ncbi:hypothetical protein Dxin01_02611 [Deinococcus xinjiangensis]|uniref:Alpha/beta hydrolase n=1 Tax=Deinococcus xinjiangensis TaxID=457454 RepID=A0ABP9VC92_9DEIO
MIKKLALTSFFLGLSLGAAQTSTSDQTLQNVPAVRVVRPSVQTPNTPANLNASITVRYGPQSGGKPRAVLLLMPGYLGGAGSFDRLARQIVALRPDWAVWAVDRRANLLEPQSTLGTASPSYLAQIVQKGMPPLPAAGLGYMQNWGLDTTLRDWRTAVQEAAQLTPNVFIGGHSLGAALSGLYAAYDFDGQRGYDDVRGLVMLDGFPGLMSGNPVPMREYNGGTNNVIGSVTGRNDLKNTPYVNTFYFGPTLASRAAAQARLAAQHPYATAPAQGFLGWPATNLAAAMTTISQRYARIPFLAVTAGRATNAKETPSLLPRLIGGRDTQSLVGPQDPQQPIGWQLDSSALTNPFDFVRRFWNPLSDATEWYFPWRLVLDVAAARTDTRGTPYENILPVWHSAAVTLPVLGIAASEGVTNENDYRRYASAHLQNLTTHTLKEAAHLDMTFASGDQVARWIVDWLGQNLAR